MSLLSIENLSLQIGATQILRGIDLSVTAGEVMGLVGESGSGKSMTALSAMRLLPEGTKISGRILFDGVDLLAASEGDMCALRGNRIGMIFQEPMTALNPLKRVGEQVAEAIRWHARASRAEAESLAGKALDRVGLPASESPLHRFPHELSGGQRQRVVIAMACALKPKLLIADEPTTALDVVLQAQILELLGDLLNENRMGLLLISHDLAVVAEMADRVTILRQGAVTEAGETARLLSEQSHPYTRQLAQASLHVPDRRPLPPAHPSPLLAVKHVTKDYPGRRASLFGSPRPVRAVDDVSLDIGPGQCVALVGRSGCGKSTLARMILALDPPTSGTISFAGSETTGKSQAMLRPMRRDMQVVFQDPYGSLDPRQTVGHAVGEPLYLLDRQPTQAERRERIAHALQEVGLRPDDMRKFPHEFSGGQRQRLSIARAVITRPKLVVADEPVSALDVSIRADILDLFADVNQRLGIAFLFITHDLAVARAITDDVLVMDKGRIVERGRTAEILSRPVSDAARALVAAAPDLRGAISRKLREQG